MRADVMKGLVQKATGCLRQKGLMLLGIPASDAAAYAVIYRMFLVASVVVVSLAIGSAYGILHLRGPIARLKSAYQEHRYA